MRKKLIKISIILSFAIFMTCGLVFCGGKERKGVFAANTQVECFTLVARDAVENSVGTYQSINSVGVIDGTGYYLVGDTVNLKATAKSNYQVLGFEVTYLDQAGKVDIFWLNDGDSSVHTLTYADGATAEASLIKIQGSPLGSLAHATSVIINIGQVGENLKITPIFDHLYGRIQIDNTQGVLLSGQQATIGSTTINFSSNTVEGDVTIYEDTYIESDNVRYYYGTVYASGSNLYTLHERQDESATQEKIDISLGAFRQDESVNMALDVADYFDVLGVLTLRETAFESINAIINKSAEGNTTSVTFDAMATNFNTSRYSDLLVEIQAHKLHRVTMEFFVDGEALPAKHYDDFFGNVAVNSTTIQANVSTNNYFSAFETIAVENEQYPTQYFIKSYANNNQKSFMVQGVNKIIKAQDGLEYSYYLFSSLELNGVPQGSNSLSLSEPSNLEITVRVNYTSVEYYINFEFRENQSGVLVAMQGGYIEPISLFRGEGITIGTSEGSNNIAQGIDIAGYLYRGLSLNGDDYSEIFPDLTIEIDEQKPTDITVYVVFEKIGYTVVLTNVNSINLRGVYALKNITFDINGNQETWENADTSQTSHTLANKIKINQTLSLAANVNTGFVVSFNLAADGSLPIEGLLIDETIISMAVDNSIYIFVVETCKTYTLIYITQAKLDENLSEKVIMADIGVDIVDVLGSVEISNVEEIYDGNKIVENKITISGLFFGDQVKLTSAAREQTGVAEPYYYLFNKFYQGQVTNILTNGEDYYTHTQNQVEQTIYVVYGLPKVYLEISWDTLTENDFEYTVTSASGAPLTADEDNPNKFTAAVGETVNVNISNIKFGYSLTKYNYNYSAEDTLISTYPIKVVIGASYNSLKLIFSVDQYRVYFKQWGEEYNGENYVFGGVPYKKMTADDCSVTLSLPQGIYVGRVSVKSLDLEQVFEGSSFKQDNFTESTNYDFILNVEQFSQLIQAYADTDDNGYFLTIDLLYLKHEYSVVFKLNISGGTAEVNSVIPAPTLTLQDGYGGTINSVEGAGEQVQTFKNIKYGTSLVLTIGNDLKQGLVFNTWHISGMAQTDGANKLIINQISGDVVAEYVVIYVPYTIKLYGYTGYGTPNVNGIKYSGTQTINVKLFESLTIDPNAEKGIQINSIRNINVYSYNAATWREDYLSLFYRKNGEILPAEETYDANKIYFSQEKTLAVSLEGGNPTFKDADFDIKNYFLSNITSGTQTLNCLCFELVYEYIQYSLEHTVTGIDKSWLDMFGDKKIYSFEHIGGGEFDLTQTYTKHDGINYIFKITDKGYIDGVEYNLTKDIVLNSIKVGEQYIDLPANNDGKYAITLNIENHLPQDTSTTIEIEYELAMTKKKVELTTQIESDNSGEFTNNITFYLQKNGGAPQPTSGKLFASQSFNYLTHMVKMSAQFRSALSENFEFGEVKIYLNGSPVNENDYAVLGITVVRNETSAVTNVQYRLSNDIKCEFIVRPKINNFKSGDKFTKEFKCNSNGVGVAQTLTVGENAEIDISNLFEVSISYQNVNGIIIENPTDVGLYTATISFVGDGWMSQIGDIGTAILEITPKVITAMFNANAAKKTKTYNGMADYYLSSEEINQIVFDFKAFADGGEAKLSYPTVKSWAVNAIGLSENKISAFSTTGGENGKTANANENLYYNLYVQGLNLTGSNNFILSSKVFEILNYLQIKRKTIQLINVDVNNKVFDGTTAAKIKNNLAIDIIGEVEGEQLMINVAELRINFEDNKVGGNKKVVVSNIRNSITENNCDANNYVIQDSMIVETNAGIYPDKISVTIRGVGEISLINKRGVGSDDDNLITLLPINSRLSTQVIYQDSQEYRNLYRIFGKNVRGNNIFAIGYTFKLMVNEAEQPISKDLFVQVPNIKNMTGAYYLTGDATGKIDYELTREGILIDLQNLSVDLDSLMFTQQRILFKIWQIVLIIVLLIVMILLIILIIILIRRRKKKDYSLHESI